MLNCFHKRALFLLSLLFTSSLVQAQWQWKVQVLDTADVDITAMGVADDLVIWASLPDGSSYNPATGPLRLQVRQHHFSWRGDSLAPTQLNVQFQGQFRANSLLGLGNMAIARMLVAGGFRDTCYLPNDTLIGFEPQSLDPFLMRVNAANGQPEWIWSRPQTGNNFIHKIHYNGGSEVLASGQFNDSTGWLAAFDIQTGQLLWEKAWPGSQTLSDARFGINPNTQEVIFTGTMTDSGYLNHLPVPLNTLPITGFRNFLAIYWPSTDSVAYMASTPCDSFSFEPSLMSGFEPLTWSTPSLENGPQRKTMSFNVNPISSSNVEYFEAVQWYAEFDNPAGLALFPLFFYQGRHAAPNQYYLHYGQSSLNWPDTLELAMGSMPRKAAGVSDITRSPLMHTYFTIKSTGDIQIRRNWWQGQANYVVEGASQQSPRWVILYSSNSSGGVEEDNRLNFKIYPNPNSIGLARIQLEKEVDLPSSWRLHDLKGKLLVMGSLAVGENLLPLPKLSQGIYLIEVEQAGRKGWQRLVVH